jgi:predicted SnoaL-like aldol condensation-catalyzing enzyme
MLQALVLAAVTTHATPATIMTGYVNAVNARRYDDLRALLSPNLVQHFSDMHVTLYGPDALVKRFQGVIAQSPDLHLSLARLISDGDTFATMIDATYTRNSKRVNAFWIDIWRISGGKIVEHWES